MNIISYPGFSAELVINKNLECNHFFELVSSCGVFCRMPESMQARFIHALDKDKAFKGIIFITDAINKSKLTPLFHNVSKTVHMIDFENIPQKNQYGLRINTPIFKEIQRFKKLLKKNPDFLVLVSTPYSCPDLSLYISNEDTLANRSSLFFFENKKIYSNKFAYEMNFMGEFNANNLNALEKIVASSDDTFFLKPLGEYTGGTSVIPLTKDIIASNRDIVKHALTQDAHFLYRNINSLNISSSRGVHHGTQFRVFLNNQNECVGFIVKFSAEAIRGEHQRSSIRQLNKLLNSSSGSAISILFECKASITPRTLSLSKNEVISEPTVINEYLKDLRLGELLLSDPDDLERIKHILLPKTVELLNYMNDFFFSQKWDRLYGKFITHKTYFDEVAAN